LEKRFNSVKVSLFLLVAVGSAAVLSALAAAAYSPSYVLDFLLQGDKPVISEASAKILPVEINELYRAKRIAGDGATGSYQLQIYENYIDDTKHCEFCTRVMYIPGGQGVSAFSFRDDTGYDLTGAKRAKFFIMGEQGGESISFKVAGKVMKGNGVADKLFKNMRFESETENIVLDKEWKVVEIDLRGKDLRNITDPLGFEVKKGKDLQPVIFYLKQIVFDTEPPKNPVSLKTRS